MSLDRKFEDVLARPGMYLSTPDRFLAVAGFFQGVRWADPESLSGIEDFVRRRIPEAANLVWTSAAVSEICTKEELRRLNLGTSSAALDETAARHLLSVVHAYIQSADDGA